MQSALNLERVRAISLDLDDTLWPIAPTIRRAEAALLQWLAGEAPGVARLLAVPEVALRLRKQVVQAATLNEPAMLHDLSAVRRETLRAAFLEAGDDGEKVDTAFEIFYAERQRVDLFDDALYALQFLSQRLPLLGLSNGNADLHRIGIGGFFFGSLSSRDVGASKPDARNFQSAAERLGVDIGEVLHIGDDAEMDVVGAMRSGMQTVWLNRSRQPWLHQERPHATVVNLRQLCEFWRVDPDTAQPTTLDEAD